ncbi:hypothetical protein GE21DRAFT_4990 [Neurospora crassa]|uniref:Uncharacterized protein n=1 Tax=Neurospora crassa (strain ATCC 24698 / 74-OR23-1A / CBS 708.71 / DSM 1257 / FGSC 987) TaxID=367110 RepID=Q7S3N4_NEUCR|nr:hypothetical protein NCU08209 [Neurospora crassa OR74A]EAA30063.1 hypothetical protein NCU08209 [Neurospora crassa OR74A]KHE86456.1 hypothetical protein GE21DRAFT_4990 [Neurospora crassa]|eukprot:XP_959299.1 hypothetical protein NCU08209 [Neurospora crassa OR74A]
MSSPSNNPRRSQSPDSQPPRNPRLLQAAPANASGDVVPPLDEERLTAIVNRVLDAYDPNDFFGSMAAAFDRMREASGGDLTMFREIGLRAVAEIARRRNPEYVPNPAPPYTALPAMDEVTVALSVEEPEYTPRYTRYAQGQKRKREEGDTSSGDQEEEDDNDGEDEEQCDTGQNRDDENEEEFDEEENNGD